MTKEAKPEPVFACNCAQDCEQGVEWLSRAPQAQCFPDGKCKCKCHAFAKENQAARVRWHDVGGRWRYER